MTVNKINLSHNAHLWIALFSFGNRITKWVSVRYPILAEDLYTSYFKQSDLLFAGIAHRAILWDSNDFMEILDVDVPLRIDPPKTSYINFEFIRPTELERTLDQE